MLKQEVIIRATEETKKKGYSVPEGFKGNLAYVFTKAELKQLLKDTFDAGSDYGEDSANSDEGVSLNFNNKQDYINDIFK